MDVFTTAFVAASGSAAACCAAMLIRRRLIEHEQRMCEFDERILRLLERWEDAKPMGSVERAVVETDGVTLAERAPLPVAKVVRR